MSYLTKALIGGFLSCLLINGCSFQQKKKKPGDLKVFKEKRVPRENSMAQRGTKKPANSVDLLSNPLNPITTPQHNQALIGDISYQGQPNKKPVINSIPESPALPQSSQKEGFTQQLLSTGAKKAGEQTNLNSSIGRL